MKRRTALKNIGAAIPALWLSNSMKANPFLEPPVEKMMNGPFKPDWNSLKQYTVPQWYRNAKFGIWAHWGPQCQPEFGDWYARTMYIQGSNTYNYHVAKYGHPSKFGFKDVIHEWKAEKWDPEALMKLYKRAGAQYFVALANHHDNFDNYNSKYQSWNAVTYGPKKDLIGGWAEAARNNGMRFGVSVHAAHAWIWYEQAQKADKTGAMKGVPYDGNLTKKTGAAKWWNGLDPQELYAQNHPLSKNSDEEWAIGDQWDWSHGATPPSKAYCDKFFNRTVDLINQYNPDLVYFDDTALPLWPVNDAGLRIAAHLYNKSIKQYGSLEAVLNGKVLSEEQRKCMVWDIERGQSNTIEPEPWQTDTCIGNWHYDRPLYERNGYKTSTTVIHTLIDVVSKNGNLLLSVPVRGNGTIDEKEQAIVEGIADWIEMNGKAIFDTRPWKVFGEGPAIESAEPISAQGFNEGKGKPFTYEDVRFTTKENILYAFLLGMPNGAATNIRSLGSDSMYAKGKKVESLRLIGFDTNIDWVQTPDALQITIPGINAARHALVLEIRGVV